MDGDEEEQAYDEFVKHFNTLSYKKKLVCLNEAARKGELKLFRNLMAELMNFRDDKILLLWSVMDYGHFFTARLLFSEYGMDAKAKGILKMAVAVGSVDMVRLLLEHGADIHSNRNEALETAVHHGFVEIVGMLLDGGADIRAHGDMVVPFAINSDRVDMVRFIVERGACISNFFVKGYRYCYDDGRYMMEPPPFRSTPLSSEMVSFIDGIIHIPFDVSAKPPTPAAVRTAHTISQPAPCRKRPPPVTSTATHDALIDALTYIVRCHANDDDGGLKSLPFFAVNDETNNNDNDNNLVEEVPLTLILDLRNGDVEENRCTINALLPLISKIPRLCTFRLR